MAAPEKQPFNPCSLAEEEQIPGKCWELLRRNRIFRVHVECQRSLDALAQLECKDNVFHGPAWTKAWRLVQAVEIRNALAALALQWLVPEPLFSAELVRNSRLEKGEGVVPDPTHPTWKYGPEDGCCRIKGHLLRRGPHVLLQRDENPPFKEWLGWKPGDALFDCDTPWPQTPTRFRLDFSGTLMETSMPHEEISLSNWRLLDWLRGVAERGSISAEDLAEAFHFDRLVRGHRLFAITRRLTTKREAERIGKWVASELKKGHKEYGLAFTEGLHRKGTALIGTYDEWAAYLAAEDTGIPEALQQKYAEAEIKQSQDILGAGFSKHDETMVRTQERQSHEKDFYERVRYIERLIAHVYPLIDLQALFVLPPHRTRPGRRKSNN